MMKRHMQFGSVQMCQSESALSAACVPNDYLCTGRYMYNMIWKNK